MSGSLPISLPFTLVFLSVFPSLEFDHELQLFFIDLNLFRRSFSILLFYILFSLFTNIYGIVSRPTNLLLFILRNFWRTTAQNFFFFFSFDSLHLFDRLILSMWSKWISKNEIIQSKRFQMFRNNFIFFFRVNKHEGPTRTEAPWKHSRTQLHM